MKNPRLRMRVMGFAAAAAIVAAVPPVTMSAQNVAERFTGFAINLNSGPNTARVEFNIERWSTDAERAQLLGIIRDNKDPNQKLLDAVQKLPKVGWIHRDTKLAWISAMRTRCRSRTAAARSCSAPIGRFPLSRRGTIHGPWTIPSRSSRFT